MKKTFLTLIAGFLAGMLIAGVIWNTTRQPQGVAIELRPPPTEMPASSSKQKHGRS